MKGKFVATHGLMQDVAIGRSHATGKQATDGRAEVGVVRWIETIDGHLVEEGKTTVRLPRCS